jgi:hypothetical protein
LSIIIINNRGTTFFEASAFLPRNSLLLNNLTFLQSRLLSKICLRDFGPHGFFAKSKGSSAHILTEDIIEKAQELLYKGAQPSEVAQKLLKNKYRSQGNPSRTSVKKTKNLKKQ